MRLCSRITSMKLSVSRMGMLAQRDNLGKQQGPLFSSEEVISIWRSAV